MADQPVPRDDELEGLKPLGAVPDSEDIDIPEYIQTPIENDVANSVDDMIDASPRTIDSLVQKPDGPDFETIEARTAFYKSSEDVDTTLAKADAQAELYQSLKDKGVGASPSEWESMGKSILMTTKESAERVGAWAALQRRMDRTISSQIHDIVDIGKIGLNLGLGLLDLAGRGANAARIKLMIPDEDAKRAAKARYLPKVRLTDRTGAQHEFSTTAGSAVWLLGQKIYGLAESAGGLAMHGLTAPIRAGQRAAGAEPGPSIGEDTAARGFARQADAAAMVPTLGVALVENLDVISAMEKGHPAILGQILLSGAKVSEDEKIKLIQGVQETGELWPVYSVLDSTGMYGDIALAIAATGNTAGEFVVDPLIITGVNATKAVPALRSMATKIMPRKMAQAASQAARTTVKAEDAIEAVNQAKTHLHKVERSALTEANEAGGIISQNTIKEIQLARRNLVEEERWLRAFTMTEDQLTIKRTMRRDPEFVPETKGKHIDELAAERDKFRRSELKREADSPMNWDDASTSDMQQRTLFGPDDAEQAGDSLNLLTRSGADAIDDIAMTPPAPEVLFNQSDIVSMLDWRVVDELTKTERQLALTGQAKRMTFGHSAQRMLARNEDIIKRNLGEARRSGDKIRVNIYEADLVRSKASREIAKKLTDGDLKLFDNKLLPKPEGVMSNPRRLNGWLSAAGDRVARGLYPGSLTQRFSQTRFSRMLMPMREPLRMLETYNPAAGEHLRRGVMRYDMATQAYNNKMERTMARAGVLVKRSNFNPKKDFAPFRLDNKRNEQLFDLLDTPKDSEKWAQLAAGADEKLLKAHDEIRVVMDDLANQQGLTGTQKKLDGYIRHVFTEDQFVNGARPNEYTGLSRNGEIYASHLLDRTGKAGYSRDAVAALDLYGRASNKYIHMEPLYKDMLDVGDDLARQFGNTKFSSYMEDLVGNLKGRPSHIGQQLGKMKGNPMTPAGEIAWKPGNKTDEVLTGLSGLVWAGSLAGNPRYGLMQITTGAITTASRFGLFRTSKGMLKMLTPEGQAMSRKLGFYDTVRNILDDTTGSNLSKANEVMSKASRITDIEAYSRGVASWAAFDEYMAKYGVKSFKEAKEKGVLNRIAFDALRAAEETNHMYGPLGRPPAFARMIGKGPTVATTQFLSFGPKQIEELTSQAARNPGAMVSYLAYSGYMSRLMSQNLGIDVTNYVGAGFVDELGTGMESPLVDAFVNVMALNDAMTSDDTEGVSAAIPQVVRNFRMFLPGNSLFQSAIKGGERATTGVARSAKDRPTREVDMGSLQEAIPTLLGQQNIQDRLHRRAIRAAQVDKAKKLRVQRDVVISYVDAMETGNHEGMNDALAKMRTLGIQMSDPSNRIQTEIEARYVLQWFNQLTEGSDADKARAQTILEAHGVSLDAGDQ